jgi:hypothetical protein
MPRKNVQGFGSAQQLFPIVDHFDSGDTQCSYLVLSAGTASTNKALAFIKLMRYARRGGKIQSFIPEDRNTKTQQDLKNLTSSIHVIPPWFLPKGLGYNRNPKGWLNDEPAIVKDQDRMVREARNRANKIQEDPQMTFLFLGLAAHSQIGLSLTKKILFEFPNTTPVLVLGLPGDSGVRKIASDQGLLLDYQPIFSQVEKRNGIVVLVDESTGNGDFKRFDYKVGLGLATLEVANASENGSLADCVGTMRMVNKPNYWYGLNVVDPAHRLSTSRDEETGEFGPMDGANQVLLRNVVNQVQKVWNPDFRLASHNSVLEGSYSEIAGVLPVRGTELDEVSSEWKEAIKRKQNTTSHESQRSDFGTTSQVRFGPARFPNFGTADSRETGFFDEEMPTPRTREKLESRGLWPILRASLSLVTGRAKGKWSGLDAGSEPDLFFHVSALYPIPEAEAGYEFIPSVMSLLKNTSPTSPIRDKPIPPWPSLHNQYPDPKDNQGERNGREPEVPVPGNTS